MGKLYQIIANMFGSVANVAAESFSWIGLYEPDKPESLRKR